jgi:multicomponent Na+:H+ antiporter subunit E
VLSSLRVAQAVLSPRMPIRPGIFAYPLEVKSDLEITLLANLITLTPGTLSLDVSSDRKVLYVHGMFVDNPQAVIQSTHDSLEKAVLEVTR